MQISRERSNKLYSNAKKMFPGGVHSPVRAFKSVDGSPLFMDHGHDCHIVDVDGNEFIDFCCSWGPLILGHAHPQVVEAINETVRKGTSFGAPSELGNLIGKFILENHTYIEKIRFVSSGTEAVMSAIRLARAVSGKNKIIKFEGCYHGHVDTLMVKAGSGLKTFGESTSLGIPQDVIKDTIILPLNDLDAVSDTIAKLKDSIAAIIIEPVPANNGLLIQDKGYLEGLRKLTSENDILLIFDEVISGFRIGFEGAAGYYDIAPDILTFGKIIGGGMPVGAYGASHEIMAHVAPDGGMYQAGTLSANPVAMAAGYETLKILATGNFFEELRKKTEDFTDMIQNSLKDHHVPFHIQSIGSIFWISFDDKRIRAASEISDAGNHFFKTLYARLLNRGIYLGPSAYEVGFISVAHTDEILKEAARIISEELVAVYRNEK